MIHMPQYITAHTRNALTSFSILRATPSLYTANKHTLIIVVTGDFL